MFAVRAFQEGGLMMYAILVLGVLSVTITVERVLTLFFRMSLNKDHFFKNLTAHLLKGDLNGMILVCDQNRAPLSKVIKNCLIRLVNNGRDADIQAALDEGALTSWACLERSRV
jgi:hypothetical protein